MASSNGSRPYSYAPLAHKHIRLLCISFKESKPIYTIRHSPLNDHPPFSALSYTWDGQSRDRALSCNDGSILKVTLNVERALHYLNIHARSDSYLIWIDGVCINQENPRDKEAQIPLMGSIYAAASRVIIWLGETNIQIEIALEASSALLMNILNVRGQIEPEEHTLSKHGLPEPESPIWDGLGQIFARPWFSRLWVLQEAVLAREIDVVCGERVINLEYLQNLGKVLVLTGLLPLVSSASNAHLVGGVASLDTIQDLRRNRAGSQDQSIDFLLLPLSSDERECTEPRDRLYALIGLAADEVQKKIPIRYDISPAAVYLAYAKWEVQRRGGPIILLFACNRTKTDELPSWCPNFGAPATSHTLGLLAHTANHHAGFEAIETNPINYITCIPNSNVIKTQGLLIDRIRNKVPSGWHFYHGADSHQPKKAALQCLAWESCCLKLSQEVYKQPHTVPEGHWRTLVANKIICGACVVDQRHGYHQLLRLLHHISVHGYQPPNQALPPRNAVEMSNTARYGTLVDEAMHYRSFVSTEGGRIGLVPNDARVGDLICVLYNVSTPLILRPRAYDGKIHELVGESYVHGLMSGEALEMCNDEQTKHFLID